MVVREASGKDAQDLKVRNNGFAIDEKHSCLKRL